LKNAEPGISHCLKPLARLEPGTRFPYAHEVNTAVLVAVLMASEISTAPPPPWAYASLGSRTEPGVETKGLLLAGAGVNTRFGASFQGRLGLSAGDNPGIAHYGLGADITLNRRIPFGLHTGVSHNQWSDWQVGENSVVGLVWVVPVLTLTLGVGVARRAPMIGSVWASPFRWSGQAAEWNLLYELQWTLIRRRDASLHEGLEVWVANTDQTAPHTAQQIPFGIREKLRLTRGWFMDARIGSSIKGLSGALFSLGDVDARIGVAWGMPYYGLPGVNGS
jgi:hypothetical protein